MQIQQDMKEKSKHRCTKKECAGLDRLNPLKSFFLSVPDGIFPRYRSRSYLESWVFSVPHGQKQGTLPEPKAFQQPPFPWLLPKALGTALRQGKGNPWGCGLPCQRPQEIQSIRIDYVKLPVITN